MILVDTSVWVDHLRLGDARLSALLENGEVCVHPFVVGELACGTMRNRREVLELIANLPAASVASDGEVMAFLKANDVMGRGIGWVDVHLLASSALTTGVQLWTRDRRLAVVASRLRVLYEQMR